MVTVMASDGPWVLKREKDKDHVRGPREEMPSRGHLGGSVG